MLLDINASMCGKDVAFKQMLDHIKHMAFLKASGTDGVLCCGRSELSEHMVTTGDVGLPASALRSRYPQVPFYWACVIPIGCRLYFVSPRH